MAKLEVVSNRKADKPKKPLWREILEWVLTIVVAVVLALAIRTFLLEFGRVDGHSMQDTLQDKEIMLVTKYQYSSNWLCFPWQSNEAKEAAPRWTMGGGPERFDVVICRYPGRGDTYFVKRVIGLPGDTVTLVNGNLFVNGIAYEEPYITQAYRAGYINNGEWTVGEGQYFVMGDHRNNSNDSRAVGTISRDMIIGHVVQVVWPLNAWRGVPNGTAVPSAAGTAAE